MMKLVTVSIEFENGETEVKEYNKFGFWKIKHFNRFNKLTRYEDINNRKIKGNTGGNIK